MSKLYIVGIGPGTREKRTFEAHQAITSSEVIVGYNVYLDLLREDYPEKDYMSTPMTREVERCQTALDLALEGRSVALVCSGDSGIYGLAGLIHELRGDSLSPEIIMVPGITAATSGAALLGAPLTHDFAVISLSDRLTSWELIEKRLRLSAEADLSLVLYNPASKGRPEHLKRACKVLLERLPEDRLCGVCRNIGREGESYVLMSLKELLHYEADMFCTVFIGSESTRRIGEKMVTKRGYRFA